MNRYHLSSIIIYIQLNSYKPTQLNTFDNLCKLMIEPLTYFLYTAEYNRKCDSTVKVEVTVRVHMFTCLI